MMTDYAKSVAIAWLWQFPRSLYGHGFALLRSGFGLIWPWHQSTELQLHIHQKIKTEINHCMILCKTQGMGLPGTGVISGMREVWGDILLRKMTWPLWFMVLDRNEQTEPTRNWASFLMSFGVMLILGARISGWALNSQDCKCIDCKCLKTWGLNPL